MRIPAIAIAAVALSALPATTATAQTTGQFTVPAVNSLPRPNNLPFGGVPERYQQWYSVADILPVVDHPVRLTGIEFKALAGGSTQAAILDLEITIANGPGSPGPTFADNLRSGAVVVAPRGSYALNAAGTWPMAVLNFPQQNQFVWDGRSNLMVDVKLWGNGIPNNPPLNYDFEFNILGNRVTRLWTNGSNPDNLTTAANQRSGEGLVTRFTFEEGITVEFGAGCRGDGGFVPEASTSGGLPFPGNQAWTHELRNAPSQRNAALVLGTSNEMWGTVNLPLDLGIIGGNGCELLVEWVIALPSTTVGGGAGAGASSQPVPIPPVPGFSLSELFTQWIILDPNATNGVLTVSQGLWTIIG